MTTNATPLSAVSTIQEESSLRVLMASFSCLVMLQASPFFSSKWTSCLRLKLVELNFLVSFNTDDQSKTDVANAINVITYKSKSSR